jgi:hypothetical protein
MFPGIFRMLFENGGAGPLIRTDILPVAGPDTLGLTKAGVGAVAGTVALRDDGGQFEVGNPRIVGNVLNTVSASYSTAETWTGGYWTDGKKIYRKVVECGALPDFARKDIAHGIQNLKDVVRIYGVAYRVSGGAILPLPFATSYPANTITDNISIQIDGTNISIMTGKTGLSTLYTRVSGIALYTCTDR